MSIYWYWLANLSGIGPVTTNKLLQYFSTPKEVYEAKEQELKKILSPLQINTLVKNKNLDKLQKEWSDLKDKGIRFIHRDSKEYPERFRVLLNAPVGFYLKGKMPLESRMNIAVVGARNASAYGIEMALYFARGLAKAGVNIISGLAYGIDKQAHLGAIEVGGYTMGILGCGINICYPKENYALFEKMQYAGGILSEFPLNENPKANHFPMRNRLISGLSDGVLVVEAKEKSGSLITVDFALEQGKEVFVIPGRLKEANSVGCNRLIQEGAMLVMEPEDILSEYGISNFFINNEAKNTENNLAQKEKMVYSVLGLEAKFIDEIIENTRLTVQETLSALFSLEIKGYVKQVVKNYYIKSME
ncbi:MAG: DNA-processing protein DprA [Lachnospiraceae bacterium]|nr:DNA-processing protein DprA [Lachnospiraceae bacterium]